MAVDHAPVRAFGVDFLARGFYTEGTWFHHLRIIPDRNTNASEGERGNVYADRQRRQPKGSRHRLCPGPEKKCQWRILISNLTSKSPPLSLHARRTVEIFCFSSAPPIKGPADNTTSRKTHAQFSPIAVTRGEEQEQGYYQRRVPVGRSLVDASDLLAVPVTEFIMIPHFWPHFVYLLDQG